MRSLSDIQASGFSGDVSAFRAGDITGPASAADNRLPRFDGTTGKVLQAGQIEEDDSGNVGIGGAAVAGVNLTVGTGFTLVNLSGCTVTANSISGQAGQAGTGWTATSGHSNESYTGDVSVVAKVAGVSNLRMVLALNSDPATDSNYTSLDYGAYFAVNEMKAIVAGAIVDPAVFTAAVIGDEIGVRRVGTTIEFLLNGNVYHTVTGASAVTALYLDTAFHADGAYAGSSLTDIEFWPTSKTAGSFEGILAARKYGLLGGGQAIGTRQTSVADGAVPHFFGTGGSLVKASKLRVIGENAFLGTTPALYSGFNALHLGGTVDGTAGWVALHDTTGKRLLSLEVSYFAPNGLGGGLSLTSQDELGALIVQRDNNAAYIGQFTGPIIFGQPYTVDFGQVSEGGKWSFGGGVTLTDHANTTIFPRSITQTAASGAWTTGAYSADDYPGLIAGSYAGDVTASAIVSGSTGARVLGLSTNPSASTAVPGGIDYGIHASPGAAVQAIAGAAFTGVYGSTCALGDVLVVRRVGTSIEYYQNGVLFHTVTGVSAASALYLDTAFDAAGAALSEIAFGPPSRVAVQVHGRVKFAAGGVEFADGTVQTTAVKVTSAVTTVDFGAFPGASDASTTVTGQTGIVAGSKVKAYIIATATADHSADEHWLETIEVKAGNITPGTGFTIYAKNTGTLSELVAEQWAGARLAGPGTGINQVRPDIGGGKGTRLYGQWTVAWEWI